VKAAAAAARRPRRARRAIAALAVLLQMRDSSLPCRCAVLSCASNEMVRYESSLWRPRSKLCTQRKMSSFSFNQASALALALDAGPCCHSAGNRCLESRAARRRRPQGIARSRHLRTAAGLPRTARTAGVCLGPPPPLQCYGASAGIRVVLAGPQTPVP
jgi:hypothetical protein